jgi:hypothetical protein
MCCRHGVTERIARCEACNHDVYLSYRANQVPVKGTKTINSRLPNLQDSFQRNGVLQAAPSYQSPYTICTSTQQQ